MVLGAARRLQEEDLIIAQPVARRLESSARKESLLAETDTARLMAEPESVAGAWKIGHSQWRGGWRGPLKI